MLLQEHFVCTFKRTFTLHCEVWGSLEEKEKKKGREWGERKLDFDIHGQAFFYVPAFPIRLCVLQGS